MSHVVVLPESIFEREVFNAKRQRYEDLCHAHSEAAAGSVLALIRFRELSHALQNNELHPA